MKKEKPAIRKEVSFREYLLVFKYFMKQTRCPHVTGFVNHPLLSANLKDSEIEVLAQSARKHGMLVQNGDSFEINHTVAAFLNLWVHSPQIVMLKKPSYETDRAIAFARADNLYLAAVQSISRDQVILLADSDPEILYEYLRKDIEKKDADRKFKLKTANRTLQDNGRDVQLQVQTVNRIFLQCIENRTGKKVEADTLIHVGKENLEEIRLNDRGEIADIDRRKSDGLKAVIVAYIKRNCPEEPQNPDLDSKDSQRNDPEFYTKYSFVNLTKREAFPKGIFGLLKMQFVSFFKSFADWKNLLKRVIGMAFLAALALVWNLYALCYLNDTFDISRRAVFGKATAYLLAGVANRDSIIGLPPITDWINTIWLTVVLYFLAAIAVRAFVQDLLPGRIKKTFLHVKTFRTGLKNYRSTARKPMSAYVWSGLAIAAVLNLLIFNPFAVCLLGVMLLCSCIKQEEGGIVPFWMIASSSLRYRRVMKGKAKAPRFGECELKLLGIGIGLLICTGLNAVLWFVLNFNFWVRLAITVAIVLFSVIKQGIVKVNKPTAVALLVLSILAIQATIVLTGASISVLADDGGWTESGGTIAGLMQNMGWETILGFSLTLAAAVAVGCVTFGFGSAVVAGAAMATFGGAAAGATFTETGRKAAYDFMWGKYSPYGGNSRLAGVLRMGVSFVPVFGNAFGVITGVRDCSYDVREGDWGALAFDSFGLAMDAYGLAGDLSQMLSHADEVSDLASELSKNSDEIAKTAGDNADELAGAAGRNADEVPLGFVPKNADDAAEAAGGNAKNYVPGAGEETNVIRDGSQLMEDGKLKPNVTYQTGEHEYLYNTNERGNICWARTGDGEGLQLKTHEGRLQHNPNSPGKLPGDQAGHVIGDRFGGSPELDNILSQLGKSNQGSYKQLENQWARALENGQNVQVDIRTYYHPDGVRPKSYYIRYWIDGEFSFVRIGN